MKILSIGATALALASVPAAIAQPQPVATVDVAESDPAAMRLAGLYLQEDFAVERGMAAFEANFDRGFAQDPKAAEMEKQFPGLQDKVKAAARATFKERYFGAMPSWKIALSSKLTALFTPSEITEMTAFMASPTGIKAMTALAEGANFDALADRAIANPQKVEVEAQDLQSAVNIGALSKLSKDELKTFFAFNMSPVGRKLQQNTTALQTILLDQVNGTIRAIQPALQAAVIDAITQHISSAGKGQ